MLVLAKTAKNPIGQNGVIALLRSKDRGGKKWEYLSPAANPGYYSEMEVFHLLLNEQNNFELAFSTGPKYDTMPVTKSPGGLDTITSENPFSSQENPVLLNSFQDGLYACRVIPELGNVVVGFDHRTGGLRRTDVKTHYHPINKNFLDWKVE